MSLYIALDKWLLECLPGLCRLFAPLSTFFYHAVIIDWERKYIRCTSTAATAHYKFVLNNKPNNQPTNSQYFVLFCALKKNVGTSPENENCLRKMCYAVCNHAYFNTINSLHIENKKNRKRERKTQIEKKLWKKNRFKQSVA